MLKLSGQNIVKRIPIKFQRHYLVSSVRILTRILNRIMTRISVSILQSFWFSTFIFFFTRNVFNLRSLRWFHKNLSRETVNVSMKIIMIIIQNKYQPFMISCGCQSSKIQLGKPKSRLFDPDTENTDSHMLDLYMKCISCFENVCYEDKHI